MRLPLFLAALAVALVFPAGAAAEGWYLSAFAGPAFHNDYGGHGAKADFGLKAGTGYAAGAALGHEVLIPGLSAEAEVSYRSVTASGLWDGCTEFPLKASDTTFAVMGNAVYRLPLGSGFTAHALAGGGFASRRIAFDPAPDNFASNGGGAEEMGFAYQAGAGVDYALTEQSSVGLRYVYFVAPSIDRVVSYGYHDTFMEADGDSHAFLLTGTFVID